MRNNFSKIALAAGVSLAFTFTFGCSDGGGGNGGGGSEDDSKVLSSAGGVVFSSSSLSISSSSVAVSSSSSSLTLSSSSVVASSSSSYSSSSSFSLTLSSSSVVESSSSYSSSSGSLGISSSSLSPSSSSITIVFGPSVNYGGEIYETVVIGEQTWFKRNLNYFVEGSKCYGEDGKIYVYGCTDFTDFDNCITLSASEIQANCAKYGRLYYWATAMSLPADCNSMDCTSQANTKHRGICPSGWHIPNNADWDKLIRYIDVNREEEYGFSAIKGGLGVYDIRNDGLPYLYFHDVGFGDYWWSASESHGNGTAYVIAGGFPALEATGYKFQYISVRCLQD